MGPFAVESGPIAWAKGGSARRRRPRGGGDRGRRGRRGR